MSTSQRDQLIQQLNWRYATKQFDTTRKISAEDWAALQRAIALTPSSFGLSPWKAIVVTNQAVKDTLVGAAWGQRQVADASHVVVFAVKTDLTETDIDLFLQRVSDVRGVPVNALAGYRDMMVGSIVKSRDQAARVNWAAHQAYIALGNLLTSAAILGIDAGPMEGFDRSKFDQILGLASQGLTSVVMCVLGYRSADDKYASLKKVRFEDKDVFVTV
jgi:nitroreductase